MPKFVVNLKFEKPEARALMKTMQGDNSALPPAIKPLEGYLKHLGIKIESAYYDDND